MKRVLLVGGTHSNDDDWFRAGSRFVGMLQDYGFLLINQDRPFKWSARLDGFFGRKHPTWKASGENLYAYLDPPLCPEKKVPASDIRIVTHSHGLQVVLYACAAGLKINTLISVGSPVRRDMRKIAEKARPNIKHWLHLKAGFKDIWQVLGELGDGRLGIYRDHPLADRNDPMPGGHSDVLHNVDLLPLWRKRGWLAFLGRDYE